jgi:phage tail sheath gpL-like
MGPGGSISAKDFIMAIYQVITVLIDETKANVDRDLIAESGHSQLAGLKIKDFLKSITSGIRPARVRTENNAVRASGTLIGTSVVATDAVAINGLTLTAVASGATAVQFNIGASDTLTMANLAAAINANTDLNGIVTAESSGTTCTVYAARPGKIGNAITLTSADATIVASAAKLADGSDGESDRTHYYGSAS